MFTSIKNEYLFVQLNKLILNFWSILYVGNLGIWIIKFWHQCQDIFKHVFMFTVFFEKIAIRWMIIKGNLFMVSYYIIIQLFKQFQYIPLLWNYIYYLLPDAFIWECFEHGWTVIRKGKIMEICYNKSNKKCGDKPYRTYL